MRCGRWQRRWRHLREGRARQVARLVLLRLPGQRRRIDRCKAPLTGTPVQDVGSQGLRLAGLLLRALRSSERNERVSPPNTCRAVLEQLALGQYWRAHVVMLPTNSCTQPSISSSRVCRRPRSRTHWGLRAILRRSGRQIISQPLAEPLREVYNSNQARHKHQPVSGPLAPP